MPYLGYDVQWDRKTLKCIYCSIAPHTQELGVTRQTLYQHFGPDGALRLDGPKGKYYHFEVA